jgi:hypothetical protein
LANGSSCSSGGQCCGGGCYEGICFTCMSNGQYCSASWNCCSGNCAYGSQGSTCQ